MGGGETNTQQTMEEREKSTAAVAVASASASMLLESSNQPEEVSVLPHLQGHLTSITIRRRGRGLFVVFTCHQHQQKWPLCTYRESRLSCPQGKKSSWLTIEPLNSYVTMQRREQSHFRFFPRINSFSVLKINEDLSQLHTGTFTHPLRRLKASWCFTLFFFLFVISLYCYMTKCKHKYSIFLSSARDILWAGRCFLPGQS